jgi:CRP-like cAMP-binding protein
LRGLFFGSSHTSAGAGDILCLTIEAARRTGIVRDIDASDVIEQLGLPYFRDLATFGALADEMIVDLLCNGRITRFETGEYLARFGEPATSFHVVLKGRFAFYKRAASYDVLTRYFRAGEQSGFDLMIGMIDHDGTDVALEPSLLLEITREQFHNLHLEHAQGFGLLMINLARELSREIALLEEVIGQSTGWILRDDGPLLRGA